MPFVRLLTLIGPVLPVPVLPPGEEVTVYEVINAPPFSTGGSKLTNADASSAAAAVTFRGAPGGVALVVVNVALLTATPPGVAIVIFPTARLVGAEIETCVAEMAVTPTSVSPILASLAPERFVPVTVTTVPQGPEVGLNEVIVGIGASVTTKSVELRTLPPSVVTAMRPDVPLPGTDAVSCVATDDVEGRPDAVERHLGRVAQVRAGDRDSRAEAKRAGGARARREPRNFGGCTGVVATSQGGSCVVSPARNDRVRVESG